MKLYLEHNTKDDIKNVVKLLIQDFIQHPVKAHICCIIGEFFKRKRRTKFCIDLDGALSD